MARHHLHRREPAYQQLNGRDPLPDPIAEPSADPLPRAPAPQLDPAQTVVSVVYVTAAKTFSGPIAGYTTVAVGPPIVVSEQTSSPTVQPTDIQTSTPTSSDDDSTTSSTTTSVDSTTTTSTLSTSTSATSTTASSSSISAAAATGTGAGVSQSSPSSGLSGAAKAGIVLAVLVGVGLLLAVILLFFRRKKKVNDSYNKASDEGSSFARNEAPLAAANRDSIGSTDTTGNAPQLSLRPVTQFRPNFDPNRKSAGNPLAAQMAIGAASRGSQASIAGPPPSSGSALERKATPSPTNDPANPFGNHAEPSERAIVTGPGAGTAPQVDASAFPAPSNGMAAGGPSTPGFAAAAAAAAGAGLVAGAASSRQNPPPPLDLNNGRKFSTDTSASQISLPLSDTGSDNSRMSAMTPSTPTIAAPAAAATAAAGAASPTSSPVHRVQLDFKPSMADELGLRAGQLVRLLHEYDDGWVSSQRPYTLNITDVSMSIGSMHSPRPLPARCLPPYLSLQTTCQAPSKFSSLWSASSDACCSSTRPPSYGSSSSASSPCISSWKPALTKFICRPAS
jgi:hypothetical protein